MSKITFEKAFPEKETNSNLIQMFNIINSRKKNPLHKHSIKDSDQKNYIYCEKHHIIPVSWYKSNKFEPDNSDYNTVNLTFQEHVLVHVFLKKYYRDIDNFYMFGAMAKSITRICYGNQMKINLLEYGSKEEKDTILRELELAKIEANKVKSIQQTGKPCPWNKGRKLTEAQKDAIRKANLGKVVSAETRRKLATRKGKKLSKEEIRKRKESMKGKKWYTNGKIKIFVKPENLPDDSFITCKEFKKIRRRKHKQGKKFWIYLGYKSQLVPIEEFSELEKNGWKKGRGISGQPNKETRQQASERLKNNKFLKGKIAVHKGSIIKYVFQDQIPPGFTKGLKDKT